MILMMIITITDGHGDDLDDWDGDDDVDDDDKLAHDQQVKPSQSPLITPDPSLPYEIVVNR